MDIGQKTEKQTLLVLYQAASLPPFFIFGAGASVLICYVYPFVIRIN